MRKLFVHIHFIFYMAYVKIGNVIILTFRYIFEAAKPAF